MAERGGLPWYCVWTDFPVHPKTLALCGRLRDENAGMYVLRLFSHCATHALDGLIEADVVEGAAGWRKKRGVLLAALVSTGALEAREGGRYEVHGWVERNGARIREWLRCNAKRKPRNPDEDAQGTPDEPHKEPRENPAGFSGGTPDEPRVPYEIRKTEKKQKPARLQRAARADGEPTLAPEAAEAASPPPAVEAASGATSSQPEPERQEVPHALATHPGAADEPTPPASSAAAAPMRAGPGPVVDDMPYRPLLFSDAIELPAAAADVRGEIERQIGKRLSLSGREDFAAQVERLEREEEGLALRECTSAACELFDREGQMPGSLEWFARAMAKHLGPPALGAPPPLPGPDEAWLASLGDRRAAAARQWATVLERVTGPKSAVWPDRRVEVLERELAGLVARFTEPLRAAGGGTC